MQDTNDNAPLFTESAYSFDVSEDAARGARVGTVTARDSDLGQNGRVTYTVISDWDNDVFSLDTSTGVFTLTSMLDYEQVSLMWGCAWVGEFCCLVYFVKGVF